ncbi:multicopper oxidase family protein [Paenibacillus sp. P96]|uniref:Multicopper oxidase family protein n=1 Tax=Paenibacillus zeirhizosphaerae TaxID=2987519 RepID=A0ABT9FV71_9BACL|nr:multicopper oxidase family protein [Paenibacillus sp. P96]MDP4098574.1 multicopper oxidase family protein [Paenibacillus sp. P96]
MRKKHKTYMVIAAVASLSLLLAACTNAATGKMDHSQMDMGDEKISAENIKKSSASLVKTPQVLSGNKINLSASEGELDVGNGTTIPVYTFNNSIPGPQIRVKEGEQVSITLTNKLPVPTTIHWHGLPVPNAMDGIPGVTQNAIQPGETFTYSFTASTPGTYWYHSHQDAVNQLDKGLYGSFVVEEASDSYDRDFTLMLDEWASSGTASMDGMNMSEMDGMDMSNTESSGAEEAAHDMSMYDLYTINGKMGTATQTLKVKKGEKVRLRLINAGFLTHEMHLHGHDFRVVALDGQSLNEPTALKDQLISIAPGERYDIEFVADNPGEWLLEEHGDDPKVEGMRVKIAYEEEGGTANDAENSSTMLPTFDMTSYGKAGKKELTPYQFYDVRYTMELGTKEQDGETVYTLNGKTYPDTENIAVKKGDKVLVRMVNNSATDDHPMHLHGHFFQVLSKNGTDLTGSRVLKDTINLKPGEEVIVAFIADNPGNWMFHCHDLHHASAGMMTEVTYSDFKSTFVNDPKAGNKPE